jgi:hypothetical protein
MTRGGHRVRRVRLQVSSLCPRSRTRSRSRSSPTPPSVSSARSSDHLGKLRMEAGSSLRAAEVRQAARLRRHRWDSAQRNCRWGRRRPDTAASVRLGLQARAVRLLLRALVLPVLRISIRLPHRRFREPRMRLVPLVWVPRTKAVVLWPRALSRTHRRVARAAISRSEPRPSSS